LRKENKVEFPTQYMLCRTLKLTMAYHKLVTRFSASLTKSQGRQSIEDWRDERWCKSRGIIKLPAKQENLLCKQEEWKIRQCIGKGCSFGQC